MSVVVVVALLFCHLHVVLTVGVGVHWPRRKMIRFDKRTSRLRRTPLAERQIVGHAQILGPLDEREQVQILILIPTVLDPVDMRVARCPTELAHIEESAEAEFHGPLLARFQVQSLSHRHRFETAFNRDNRRSRRHVDREASVAVKEGESLHGRPKDHRLFRKRSVAGVCLTVTLIYRFGLLQRFLLERCGCDVT